jgi:hypothetical protein
MWRQCHEDASASYSIIANLILRKTVEERWISLAQKFVKWCTQNLSDIAVERVRQAHHLKTISGSSNTYQWRCCRPQAQMLKHHHILETPSNFTVCDTMWFLVQKTCQEFLLTTINLHIRCKSSDHINTDKHTVGHDAYKISQKLH